MRSQIGNVGYRAIGGKKQSTPPASLLLVHGAGSGPCVFRSWASAFPGIDVVAIDLQEGLDIRSASMRDYAAAVMAATARLRRPTALCGWSMGGLVVLLAALKIRPDSVILLESSPPGEVQGFNPDVALREGTFDPEEAYGRFPAGQRARPESLLARAERKRGIPIPEIPGRSLVVYGDSFPEERGRRIASLYGSEERYFPGLDHWGLVLDPAVRVAIAEFPGSAAERSA